MKRHENGLMLNPWKRRPEPLGRKRAVTHIGLSDKLAMMVVALRPVISKGSAHHHLLGFYVDLLNRRLLPLFPSRLMRGKTWLANEDCLLSDLCRVRR